MNANAFWNFLFLSLHRHRSRHGGVLVISFIIIVILCSVIFLSTAIRRDTLFTLEQQADLVVQRVRGGKAVDLPAEWAADFATIPGVRAAVPRIFGRYFHEPNGIYFTVVGLDPFDNRAAMAFEELFAGLDLKKFLAGSNMIAGSGVAEFLTANRYENSYDFVTPQRARIDVTVFDTFSPESGLFTSDLIVMEIDLARRILGVAPGLATDIALDVPNELEGDSVMAKLIGLQYDIRVIQKKEIAAAFDNMFNVKGGLFLILYLTVLTTFALILYERFSLITGPDRRQIGILRAVGWSISDVIKIKVAESAIIALTAFLAGAICSYLYVYFLGAPGLCAVFLGSSNLPVDLSLSRGFDPGLMVLTFLFFMVPFVAAVLVPVWRVAITEPVEAMK